MNKVSTSIETPDIMPIASKVISASVEMIDDTTIKVTKTTAEVFSYSPDFLESQIEAIQKQADDFAAARAAEIADLQAMLDQGAAAGVISTKQKEALAAGKDSGPVKIQ
jgi:hypothetical protein